MPIHDIRCSSCEIIQTDVFVRVGALPSCDECGAPTVIDWGHGSAPSVRGHGYGSFTPIDMGVLGKAETKEDYDRAVATIKQRFPNHRIELESETSAQKSARVEDLRHKSFENKRRNNVDEKLLSEQNEEGKAKLSETNSRRVRQNMAPVKPKMAAPGTPAGAA